MADAAEATRWTWTPPARLGVRTAFAFRLLWFAALALAIAAPVAGIWLRVDFVENVAMPFERLGLASDFSSGRSRMGHPYSDEAVRSGIRAGDQLIAVDGRPVDDDIDSRPAVARLLARPEGATARLRIRSPDGTERDHVLTRRQAHVDADYQKAGITFRIYLTLQLVIGTLSAIFLLLAAIVLYRRRSRETVPAALSLGFLLMAATLDNAFFAYMALDLRQLGELTGLIGWDLAIITLLIFPDGRFAQRWAPLVALLLIPEGIAVLLRAVPFGIPTFTILLGVAVTSLLLRYARLPAGAERQQIRWALFGFVTGALLMGLGTLASRLARFGFDPNQVWLPLISTLLDMIGTICFAAGLLVSLLKYRLYDADAVITRSAGYAVLTLMLAGTFAATAKGVEVLFDTYFSGAAGAWPGVIGAGLAVALITPLHGRVHAWAERRFQKPLMRMRRELPLCVGDLRETAGLDALLAEIVARVEAGVRTGRVAVAIEGRIAAGEAADLPDLPTGGGMIVERADPAFPLRLPLAVGEEAPVGWLLLGPRPDGSFYGADELEALAEIADPVARAIRIVRLREDRERESRRRADRQDRRIAALEKALKALAAR